jgi:protoheme ferro-lyase
LTLPTDPPIDSKPVIFSIIASPAHPKFSNLYHNLGFEEFQFKTIRKSMNALKTNHPDIIVAEFFYKYGTNYSSNHISNLDSLFISLQKYPDYHPEIILLVLKNEREFVCKLEQHYSIHHVLTQPVTEEQISLLLNSCAKLTHKNNPERI